MIAFTTSERFLAQWGVGTDLFIGAIREGDQCIALIARDGLTDEQAMQNARALEQALTQQRGELVPSGAGVPFGHYWVWKDGTAQFLLGQSNWALESACKSVTPLYTTPQPGAEALRALLDDMRMCNSGGPEHVYLRVTQWILELESLLARGA